MEPNLPKFETARERLGEGVWKWLELLQDYTLRFKDKSLAPQTAQNTIITCRHCPQEWDGSVTYDELTAHKDSHGA